MKASEIREMNPDELVDELENLQRRLFDIRTQAVTEKLEDPTQLTKAKRNIARLKTIIRERELAQQKSESELSNEIT
jgi:large subunit ribosomal protein L29